MLLSLSAYERSRSGAGSTAKEGQPGGWGLSMAATAATLDVQHRVVALVTPPLAPARPLVLVEDHHLGVAAGVVRARRADLRGVEEVDGGLRRHHLNAVSGAAQRFVEGGRLDGGDGA